MELDIPAQLIAGGFLASISGMLVLAVLELSRMKRRVNRLELDLREADMKLLSLIDTLNTQTRSAFARTGQDIGILAREIGVLEVVDRSKERMN